MDTKPQPINVLLIEDNAEDIWVMEKVLAKSKGCTFSIQTGERLSTGLEALRKGNIDIILLDLGLPDSFGIETFRQVQAEAADIPVIILTALENEECALASVRGGAQDYLVKGHIAPDNLLRAVRYAIERKKIEKELKNANEALEAEITERKEAEARIKASLEEKEVLLKEIHHRVRNNLQLINSLLNLQERRIREDGVRGIFLECKNRVDTIALVHEKLYESKNMANINFGDYIRTLTTHLFNSYKICPSPIRLNINTDNVFLGINKAIPCALILNELIINALKYAFPGERYREGELSVQLKTTAKGEITLIVADNGAGLPDAFDIDKSTTLGMQIISALIKQLRGSIEIAGRKGTKFIIQFQTGDM